MAHAGMTGCRTCCETVECTIASDNFDRADSSSLGTNWAVEDGVWSIASNRLTVLTSGTARFTHVDPEADDGITWAAKINFGGEAGSVSLAVDYSAGGSSGYNFARVVCSGSTSATLQLFEHDGSSATAVTDELTLTGFSWSSDFTLRVCWGYAYTEEVPVQCTGTMTWEWIDLGGGEFGWHAIDSSGGSCGVDPDCTIVPPADPGDFPGQTAETECEPNGNDEFPRKILQATFNGTQGLAAEATDHGNTGVAIIANSFGSSAWVDDAVLGKLSPSCPACSVSGNCGKCENNDAPPFLKLVIAGITNDECALCDNLNGTYILPYSGSSGPHRVACDDSGNTGTGCNWSTGLLGIDGGGLEICPCWGDAFFGVNIFEVDGEFYLSVGMGHLFDPGCEENGGSARWQIKLEGVTEPPNCYTALNHTLPLVCETHPEDPHDLSCIYTGSTATVSVP